MKKFLTLAVAFAMFLSLGATAFGAPAPVPGNPGWDVKYTNALELKGEPWDRGNADGDKITSNAHSAAFPGLYFYWNDKQKDNGVLLVDKSVFNLFEDGKFKLTAKNANMYYGYEIEPNEAHLIDGVYAYGIPKEIQFVGKNGKIEKDTLKNINMVFIDGNYKGATAELQKLWKTAEGYIESEVLNELVTFTGLKLGENTIKINSYTEAVNGKRVTVAELASEAYNFLFAELNGAAVNVTPVTDILTGEVLRYELSFTAMQENHYKVVFFNEEVVVPEYAKVIVKARWLDSDGMPMDPPPHGIDELFFGDIGKVEILPELEVFVNPDLVDLLIKNEYEITAKAFSRGGVNYEFVDPAEVIIYGAEANRVYVVIFTFQAPKPIEVDVSGDFWKIPSYSHCRKWESIGIPFCYAGEMSKDGYGYIEFEPEFFETYKSVTIRFKASGVETDVTFTADGVDADNQDMFVKHDEIAGAYTFTFDGGGMATIVELLQLREWID